MDSDVNLYMSSECTKWDACNFFAPGNSPSVCASKGKICHM